MGEESSSAWPVFGDFEAAQTTASAPLYTDGLIAVVLILIALAVALYHGLLKPRGRGRAMLLLTAPPSAIARVREMLPSARFFILGILQSLLVVSILVILMLPGEMGVRALGVEDFWLGVGQISLDVAGALVGVTLIHAWMVYTFCPSDRIALWWADYLISGIGAANLLLIPLVLRLLAPVTPMVVLTVVALIYLLYRVFVCYRGVQLFTGLRRYPLHIILYLCACEIGPLLFLLEGASISVNQ